MDNKDKVVKRQPKINKAASFKEYSWFNYEEKKLFLKAHNIELGERQGIYNKAKQEITFERCKNPFTGKPVKVKSIFAGDMKYLPKEFPVKAGLFVVHSPKNPENMFEVIGVKMTRKALNMSNSDSSALPLQTKEEFKQEQYKRIKENARNTAPKPAKRKSKLNRTSINLYKGLEVKYFVDYLPKNKYKQDVASEKILGIKSGIYKDIMWAVDLLYNEIDECSTICIVPSSYPGNTSKMTPVIKALAAKKSIEFLPVIQRIKAKDKFHSGGKRTPINEYMSLLINDSDNIRDKDIILIDDICTTGCSLFASKMLLKKNGARHVDCIVLGRTK